MERRTLHRKRKKALERLPSLAEVVRGSLLERHLRCGKPSCHCAHGKGHRVFYLTASFPGGRTQQITVPPNLVPVVRRWLDNYEQWRKVVEEVSVVNRELLRKRLVSPDETGGTRRSRA